MKCFFLDISIWRDIAKVIKTSFTFNVSGIDVRGHTTSSFKVKMLPYV